MGTETVIDIASGGVQERAYPLNTRSGVSEIVAFNNHQFLVEERDGKGLGDGTLAGVKQLFRIDLTGATEVMGLTGSPADQLPLKAAAVRKTLVLDIVNLLNACGITADQIPANIEGLALGNDVVIGLDTARSGCDWLRQAQKVKPWAVTQMPYRVHGGDMLTHNN